MKIENDPIRTRDFTESDLPLMLKWLTDDRVLEYYEGRDVRFTMDTLAAHFPEEIPDGFRVIIESLPEHELHEGKKKIAG